MFDLGWSKLIIIAMVAIVVVGPKDLPALLRAIGKFVGQLRRQADEFRRQFDEAMKDTELDQIRKDVADIKRTATESVQEISRTAEESVKPLETAAAEMTDIGNPTPHAGSSANGAASSASTGDAAHVDAVAHPQSLPTPGPELPTAMPVLPSSAPADFTKSGA